MTLYTFRQGIVSYPEVVGLGQAYLQVSGSFVNLLAANGPTVVQFGHKNTNYEFTESLAVNNAWDLTAAAGAPTYIYWDIDPTTGVRTFGYTLLQPTSGPVAPTSPADDQHWYDTNNFVMKVYQVSSGKFAERIRVFAANVTSTGSILPMGSNASSPFAGSQVGLNNNPNRAGRILFDVSGLPIVRQAGVVRFAVGFGSPQPAGSPFPVTVSGVNGTFFTTEDEFFSGGSRLNGIRLESDVVTATAAQNMAAYAVVKWTTFGTVGLANYDDSQDESIGILTEDTLLGESVTVILQGTITNEQWSWETVGAPLWILTNGTLVDIDPNFTNPVAYPDAKAPVARVLSQRQVIFMQGLGARGPRGPEGPATNTVEADSTTLGNVFLSCDPTGSPPLPVAVCIDDPVITSGPYAPFTHLSASSAHTAINIDFTSYLDLVSTTVQGALQELQDEKVAIAGDTMTGFLTLNADPSLNLHAATKNYVDNLVSGLIWLDPVCLMNLISDVVATPPGGPETGDVYIMPSGVLGGAWSGFAADDVVQWDGSAWDNGGQLTVNFPAARFTVSGTSSTVPSGTFTGQNLNIAVLGGSPVWSFEVPVDNNAVFVCNEFSAEAFNQYVYDGDNTVWVQFNGGQVVPGLNLELSGNILNVLQFSGSPSGTIDAATLQGNLPSAFAPATHTHNYDLAAFLAGVAVTGDPVGSWILTRDLTFPADFTGSAANAAIPGPTLDSKLNILQNSVIVGSCTFLSTVNAGAFASVGSPAVTLFSDGDLITLEWGSPAPDPVLKNVTITVETCASAPSC